MSLEGAPRPSLYQAMEHPPDKRVPPGCGSRKAGPSSAPYEPVASAALREAFARAIAYREDLLAGLINADNTLNDWVSIAKAIQAEQAFFVEVDVDVLAIDGDDPALADNLYDIGSELTTAGERPVVLESGQSGRLHLFCRVRDGILHERLRQRARQLGLDVRYQIRPPLSPHRLGLVPRLMLPADPQEALSALQPSNLRRRRDLSPRMRELLETGVNPRGSRSQGIISLAVSAVNARWTFSEFRTAMDRSPAGAKLHNRPDADKELRRVWAKAYGSSAYHLPSRPRTKPATSFGRYAHWQMTPLGLAELGLRIEPCWRRTCVSPNAPISSNTPLPFDRLPKLQAFLLVPSLLPILVCVPTGLSGSPLAQKDLQASGNWPPGMCPMFLHYPPLGGGVRVILKQGTQTLVSAMTSGDGAAWGPLHGISSRCCQWKARFRSRHSSAGAGRLGQPSTSYFAS